MRHNLLVNTNTNKTMKKLCSSPLPSYTLQSPSYWSSSHCLVLSTGILSSMLSLSMVITSVVVMEAWHLVMLQAVVWMQENHWDIAVTQTVWKCLDWVDRKHRGVLAGIMFTAVVHLLFSLMLLLGIMLYRRTLFIPWMVSHMIIIIIMVTTFTCWTFMSFFVDLLVAIVFPVVAGLVLGLWIVMWREVFHLFIVLRENDRHLVVMMKMQAGTSLALQDEDLIKQIFSN